MNIEQEKMIVESLPSLYPLQKFEEEAINVLVSLPIDDDAISRKAAIELCDWYDNPSMREDLEKLRPVRFSTDTISRQAAIDLIESIETERLKGNIELIYAPAIKGLRALPPAQPERIKGHWIDAVIPNDNGGLPVQVCDQCNTFFPLAYTGGGHSFCPHCGADMREVTT